MVIAIIAVLIALLLPAVQQAREAARRSQCKNNLKQLGLALHNYHDNFNRFPLSYAKNFSIGGAGNASWMQMILPYIDQAPLYDQIDFNWGLLDDPRFVAGGSDANNPASPSNVWAAQQVLSVYLCPSDDSDGLLLGQAGAGGIPIAVNNYKACCGANWAWGNFVVTTAPHALTKAGVNSNGLDFGNGIIARSASKTRWNNAFKDVSDGASNTFAIGEAVPKYCTHTWWWSFNATTATCAIPLNQLAKCTSAGSKNANLTACRGDWPNNYSFHSRHVGGGHFAICDGSVTFISENIDLNLYRSLATISGGEPASVP